MFTCSKSVSEMLPTITTNEYGAGISFTLPDRREPQRRVPKMMTAAEVMKWPRWTREQFDRAVACQEPKFPVSSKRAPAGSWALVPVWSDEQIERWIDDVRKRVQTLGELVK
jgi:hypothetical protein